MPLSYQGKSGICYFLKSSKKFIQIGVVLYVGVLRNAFSLQHGGNRFLIRTLDFINIIRNHITYRLRFLISEVTFAMNSSTSIVVVSPLRSRTETLPASASLAPRTSI